MNRARVLFGSVVTVVGALLMLDYADVLDAGDVVETWWPVVIVVAGLMALWANPQHWMMPLVVTAAGGVLLLRSTDVVDSLSVAGPVLLMMVGLLVIFGRGLNQRVVASADRVNTFNVFSGTEIASHSDHFEGGNVGALLGGAEIDLRDAQPAPGAALDVFVAFGGAEIKGSRRLAGDHPRHAHLWRIRKCDRQGTYSDWRPRFLMSTPPSSSAGSRSSTEGL